jgi:hypothetical protein
MTQNGHSPGPKLSQLLCGFRFFWSRNVGCI